MGEPVEALEPALPSKLVAEEMLASLIRGVRTAERPAAGADELRRVSVLLNELANAWERSEAEGEPAAPREPG